jgi:hypothetical protein
VYSYALSPSSTVDRDEVRDAGLTNVGMARSGWEGPNEIHLQAGIDLQTRVFQS